MKRIRITSRRPGTHQPEETGPSKQETVHRIPDGSGASTSTDPSHGNKNTDDLAPPSRARSKHVSMFPLAGNDREKKKLQSRDKDDKFVTERFDNLSGTRHKFELLIQLLPNLQERHSGCKMIPLVDTGVIELQGMLSAVKAARTEMMELAYKMYKFPVTDSVELPDLPRILCDKRCQMKLEEYLRENNTAAYFYEQQGDLMAIVERAADEALVNDIIKDFFGCSEVKLDDGDIYSFRTYDYRSKQEDLESDYCVFFTIEGSCLKIWGIAEDVEQAKKEMDDFLGQRGTSNSSKQLILKCQEEWDLIQTHFKSKLDDILYSFSPRVTVKAAHHQNAFLVTLTGSGDSPEKAAEQIRAEIIADISFVEIKLEGKSVLKTMRSWDLRKTRIQEDVSCIIKTKCIGSELETKPKVFPRKQESSETRKQQKPKSQGPPNLHVEVGNITDLQTDVIVCPVGVKKKPLKEMGAIPKALAAADSNLEKAYSKEVPEKGLVEGKIVHVSTSGDLAKHSKHVIFLAMTYWRPEGSEGVLLGMIENCLKKAGKLKASQIVFPTIGCGHLKFPLDRVATCFKVCAAKDDFKKLQITIACFNENTKKGVLAAPSSLSSTPAPAFNRKQRYAPKKIEEKTDMPCDLVISVYTKSNDDLVRVESMIKECVSDILKKQTVSLPMWDRLGEAKWNEIMGYKGDDLHVISDDEQQELTLIGERGTVEKLVSRIEEIKLTGSWVPEDPKKDIKLLLMRKYCTPSYWSGSYDLKVPVSDEVHQAVKKMVMDTFSKSYTIGRGFDAEGLSGYSKYEVINVERIQNSELYEKYWRHRRKILSRACSAGVQSVNQLKDNTGSYEADIMVKTHEYPELHETIIPGINECFLLHGTKSEIVDAISEQGLDFRLAEDGGLFGRGIYLAESISKADQYADPRKDRRPVGEELTLFVVRACLGRICIVCPLDKPNRDDMVIYKYKTPPCTTCMKDSCTEHGSKYDSVLGVTNGWMRMIFREFVIYEKDQCYPEYLVTYKRVK